MGDCAHCDRLREKNIGRDKRRRFPKMSIIGPLTRRPERQSQRNDGSALDNFPGHVFQDHITKRLLHRMMVMNRMTNKIVQYSHGLGMIVVASLAMVVAFSTSSQESTAAPQDTLTFASPQDAADHAYREAYGAYEVVEMHALVQDYYKGVLSWSDVMRQIMADQPKLARTVFETNASEEELCL